MIDVEAGIARARKIEPMLTSYGVGVPDTLNTQEDLDKGFAQIRVDHLKKVCELLLTCETRKTINSSHGSYGLKHIVERALAAYTTNGELIAAMLICGFKHKRHGYSHGGKYLMPNASFNISEKSVEWLESQDKRAGW